MVERKSIKSIKNNNNNSKNDKAKKRWLSAGLKVSAIQKVSTSTTTSSVADKNKKKQDRINKQIYKLVTTHPELTINNDNDRIIRNDDKEEEEIIYQWKFQPLLCYTNYQFVRQKIFNYFCKNKRIIITRSSTWKNLLKYRPSSLYTAIIFLLQLISIGLIVTSTMTVIFIIFSIRFGYKLLYTILYILFDLDNIKCPILIRSIYNWLLIIYNWIDYYILQRRRYAGREWNEYNEYIWRFDNNNNNNQQEQRKRRSLSLLELPPPTNNKPWGMWGYATIQHMTAIDYCYEKLKIATEKQKKHTSSKKSHKNKAKKNNYEKRKSMPIIKEIQKRRKGSGHCEESSDNIQMTTNDNNNLEVSVISRVRHHRRRSSTASAAATTTTTEDRARSLAGSPNEAIELSVQQHQQQQSPESVGNTDSELFSSDDDDDSTIIHTLDTDDTAAADMAWIDVGKKIGLRLLHSEHVQRAMASQETKDRIMGITMQNKTTNFNNRLERQSLSPSSETTTTTTSLSERQDKFISSQSLSTRRILAKPMHPMWTSPEAAARAVPIAGTSLTDMEVIEQNVSLPFPLTTRCQSFPPSSSSSPNKQQHQYNNNNNNNILSPSDQSWITEYESPTKARLSLIELETTTISRTPSRAYSGNAIINNNNHSRHFNWDSTSSRCSSNSPDKYYNHNGHKTSLSGGTCQDILLLNSQRQQQQISPPGILRGVRISSPEKWISTTANSHTSLAETAAVVPTQRRKKDTSLYVKKAKIYRRTPLVAGVKVAVPLFPVLPGVKQSSKNAAYQMATVVTSNRIWIGKGPKQHVDDTNCLSVTVKLEKCFLRNGGFAEMTFRVLDRWGPRFMPRHSKVPIGSCVATAYGIGVVVGWRVEDDCHVIRSLWQCRGPGSSNAYLNRQAIKGTIEAAIGFHVQTMYGDGLVRGCTNYNIHNYETCHFLVEINDSGRHKGNLLEIERKEILSCPGAQFMPVIEFIREAAHYQIQVDNYYVALREQRLKDGLPSDEHEFLQTWSDCASIIWSSFLRAVEEDKDFNQGVNEFMTSIIDFLDRLDRDTSEKHRKTVGYDDTNQMEIPCPYGDDEIEVQLATSTASGECSVETAQEPGFWIMNDLFGGLFRPENKNNDQETVSTTAARPAIRNSRHKDAKASHYERTFALLRTLMKTVSIARASSVDHPHFRLALAITYEFLLFIRTVVKIQQRNDSSSSLEIWRQAWDEIVTTFGPIKDRLERIGRGIALRMERQGRRAKIRVLKFFDKILSDERLLFALEQGEWDRCLSRIEISLVEAEVIEETSLVYYRKAANFVYEHIRMALQSDGVAASRNSEKLALLAIFVQSLAAPRRSILKFFCRDDMLELFERILVRAYNKEEVATRMLTIYAAHFHSLRHLRMLKDFSIAGKIWIPLLNAADEEFSWLVSLLPETSKEFMCPLSSLFSLCVAQFHKINAGDLSKDWLAFLLEEDSVRIIHDIDMKLILALQSFSHDVREMMTVLPYYPSLDEDILNLMDEVDVDEILREASNAIDDPEKLSRYVREKATIAIERFLNYLPKMSIPIEKRELGDGWYLTCHGSDGGGLTLTNVTIKRENLVCQVMGGDTLFFPMFTNDDWDNKTPGNTLSTGEPSSVAQLTDEESILDHIKELVVNAQKQGCWRPGFGGVNRPPTDRYAASVFRDIPVSNVLNCGIELWRNLEIDDDELLEIAIRDISYHIQLQEERQGQVKADQGDPHNLSSHSCGSDPEKTLATTSSGESSRHRFNPRIDPTVLFLEIKRLTLNLDNFFFRIEKGEGKTIFDPVFEGRGMLSLQNISIRLRVECAKERTKSAGGTSDVTTPVLQLKDLEVSLDKLHLTVKDTGFGSDWILNKAVTMFEDKLTHVVEENLNDQIQSQAQNAIENLNSYFLMNPDLLLNLLGISMEDLDEKVVWV